MITVTTITSEREVYSRYDPQANVVRAHIEWTGALGTELLTIRLVRLDGYGAVATANVAVPFAGAAYVDVRFPLENCVDSSGIYRARSGGSGYVVDVTDDLSMIGKWSSERFDVALFSVRQIRNELCMGIPLNTSETVMVEEQPKLVTGVTVEEISEETHRDTYDLVYNASAHTLSWNGGAPKVVNTLPWNSTVTLLTKGVRNYIRVRVKPNELPGSSVTESLLVDRRKISDAQILGFLQQAQTWVESKVWMRAEPTITGTQVMVDEMRANPLSHSVPAIDRVTLATHYERQQNLMAFTKINTPLVMIQKVHELHGYYNTSRVVTPGADWQDTISNNGFIELVPRSGAALQWQFYGGFFFGFLGYSASLPNFWHYIVTEGAPSLWDRYATMREAIGKKLAVELLTMAGFSWKPGYAAENIARDGVASSLAYSHGPGGVFQEIITPYQQWLDKEITGGRLRSSLGIVKAVWL